MVKTETQVVLITLAQSQIQLAQVHKQLILFAGMKAKMKTLLMVPIWTKFKQQCNSMSELLMLVINQRFTN